MNTLYRLISVLFVANCCLASSQAKSSVNLEGWTDPASIEYQNMTFLFRPDFNGLFYLETTKTAPDELQTSTPDIKTQTFLTTFLPLLAGKSIELLQGDLCPIIMSSRFDSPDRLYGFCDDPGNLYFSKAMMKAFGKVAKSAYVGKSGFTVVSAGISSYGAVKLSEALIRRHLSLSQLVALATLAIAFEQVSQAQLIKQGLPAEMQDYYTALDHWLGRPLFYRMVSTGVRYSLEKALQQGYFDKVLHAQIGAFIVDHSYFSQRSSEILSKGVAIGSSKIVTGALAASIISFMEIALDAFENHPEYPTAYEKARKFLSDVALAIGSNTLIAITLPVSLVSGTPKGIILGFVAANVFYFFFLFESNSSS